MLSRRLSQRGPAALEKRPPAPQHRRRREDQLDPDRQRGPATAPPHARSSRSRPTAATARRRPRSGASCRAVRGWRRRRPPGVIGSSAMPQIGQLPGALRTICGCIGQVHGPPSAVGGASPAGAGVRNRAGSAIKPLAAAAAAEVIESGRHARRGAASIAGSTVIPHTGSRTPSRSGGGCLRVSVAVNCSAVSWLPVRLSDRAGEQPFVSSSAASSGGLASGGCAFAKVGQAAVEP